MIDPELATIATQLYETRKYAMRPGFKEELRKELLVQFLNTSTRGENKDMNIIPATTTLTRNVAFFNHDDDIQWKDDLYKHLAQMRRDNIISITEDISSADILLVLTSPSFVGENVFLSAVECAIDERATTVLIIRVREVRLPAFLAKMQGLPHSGPAIADLRGKDRGLAQVVGEISQVVRELNNA